MAATCEQPHTAFIHFVQSYEPKYSKATKCLVKDRTRPARFLRFSGSALDAFADHQSD